MHKRLLRRVRNAGVSLTFDHMENLMPINGDKYEFSEKNVNNAPDVHGVYALYEGDVLTYYGRAAGDGVTIRSRLQSHRRGAEGPCTEGATHYRREQTTRPIARELELLQEYEKAYGRLPRCNKKVA